MAISYPLSFPNPNYIKTTRISLQQNILKTRSEFNNIEQVQRHPNSELWGMEIDLRPLTPAEAAEIQAFMVKLQGSYGTFELGDQDRTSPRGVATGTPLVKGASQTGNELITDGWTNSTTNILRAGDYIEVENRLYMNLDDVNSDSSGNATLTISPALRASPADNAAITTENPKARWRLSDSTILWESSELNLVSIRIVATEARTLT